MFAAALWFAARALLIYLHAMFGGTGTLVCCLPSGRVQALHLQSVGQSLPGTSLCLTDCKQMALQLRGLGNTPSVTHPRV